MVAVAVALIPDERFFVTYRFLFPPVFDPFKFVLFTTITTKLWRRNSNYLNCFIRWD